MVKIITKNTASTFNTDSNKTTKTSYKTATVFERNITTEVKGIKTILSNTEKSIGEIKKTLTSIAKKPFSGGFNSGFGDLYGATEEHEDNRKQKATYAVNNSIKALHKDLISLLGLRKTDNKPKEDNFITRLFKKIFSLSNLFRAALATLPFIFKDTISALIGKGLEKLGVNKELAAKVAHYMTPAIQGAGIGYLLFRNWKGIVAGAVVGVGYTMIQDMIDEWKNNTKDKSNDNVRRIEGLGTLTKDVLIGAGIGFGLSGIKGMIAGAVIGAAVGSVNNLITQWDQNINQPEQKTTSQHFANLGEGAFYGAITGAVIGSRFGGLKGMFIGLAAGAIVGGAAGIISSMISDWRARNAKSESYQVSSSTFKAAKAGELVPTIAEINADKEKLKELESQLNLPGLSKEELEKTRQQVIELKTDLATKQHVMDAREKLKDAFTAGKSQYDWYTTSDGRLVDMNADQHWWRRRATWAGAQWQRFLTPSQRKALQDKYAREGGFNGMNWWQRQWDVSFGGYNDYEKAYLDGIERDYRAHRLLNAEIPGSDLTYGSEGNQLLWRQDHDRELETINIGRKMSYNYLSEEKQKQAALDIMNQDKTDYMDLATNEIALLQELIQAVKSINNPYPHSTAGEQLANTMITQMSNY